jgi:O-antigen/teichoic acid export membrane protein
VFGGGLIIIFGKAFIERWLGTGYPDAFPVLVVLVTAMAVEVMIDPARTTMTAMGKIRFVGVLEMIEALLSVVLTIVLIRSHSIFGAALGWPFRCYCSRCWSCLRYCAGRCICVAQSCIEPWCRQW